MCSCKAWQRLVKSIANVAQFQYLTAVHICCLFCRFYRQINLLFRTELGCTAFYEGSNYNEPGGTTLKDYMGVVVGFVFSQKGETSFKEGMHIKITWYNYPNVWLISIQGDQRLC